MIEKNHKWTNNLAYAIGLIVTDGNLSNDQRHITFVSKDIEQIKNFMAILNLKNKIGIKRGSYSPQKKYYSVQFGNKSLYKLLNKIGVHSNKTKTIGGIKIPDRFFADFLRGLLDGDGCTYSYWDKRWKKSFMLYTNFISASEQHAQWLKNKITGMYRVDGSLSYSGKSIYKLQFAKTASVLLLKKLYYAKSAICLSRKKIKIEKAFSIIGETL